MNAAMSFQELVNLCERSEQLIEDSFRKKSRTKPSPADFKIRDRRWELLKEVTRNEPSIYIPQARNKLLRSIWKSKKASHAALISWLKEYWIFGMCKNAFFPLYENSGAKGKVREPGEKKRGRRSLIQIQTGKATGKNITSVDREKIEKGFREHYLNNETATLRSAYIATIRTQYKDATTKEQLLNSIPSFDSFLYWTDRYCKNQERIEERVGETGFKRDYRQLRGKARDFIFSAGGQHQIDSTFDPVKIVSQFDRSVIIGMPTTHYQTDGFTGMIAGVSPTIEMPSYISEALCFETAASNKVALAKRYALELDNHDWPCEHIPRVLTGDRGEAVSNLSNVITDSLGVDQETCGSYRADMKGIIENTIKESQANLRPMLFKHGGFGASAKAKRLEYNANSDACMTLDEYFAIQILNAIYLNKRCIKGYPLTPEMLKARLDKIPHNIFAWCLREGHYAHKASPGRDELWRNILPRQACNNTRTGISCNGQYFTPLSPDVTLLLQERRLQGLTEVVIAYDSRHYREIYLVMDGKFHPMKPVGEDVIVYGNYWEALATNQNLELKAKQNEPSQLQLQIKLQHDVGDILKQAKEKRKLAKRTSTPSRIIREMEKEQRRENELVGRGILPAKVSTVNDTELKYDRPSLGDYLNNI
jgi:hypothetical protein